MNFMNNNKAANQIIRYIFNADLTKQCKQPNYMNVAVN